MRRRAGCPDDWAPRPLLAPQGASKALTRFAESMVDQRNEMKIGLVRSGISKAWIVDDELRDLIEP
jgi:hypothetical protein